jgi:NAD(P)-dependent dehydrogenase (short-subunit alcohol dehydrogenase family)
MNWDFSEKVAVITGGGNGIGKAVALALSRLGCEVAVLDKDIHAAEGTCALVESAGGEMLPWQCDVADEINVENTVAQVSDKFGAIDFLFNNAGINRRKVLNEWTAKDWNDLISVNFVGSFCVARTVGRLMVANRRGSIVNMAALSGAVVGLGRGAAIYAGTKGAVAGMSRNFAAEWAPYGVRVNCIAPGWIDTEMNAPLLNHSTASQKVIERIPLGRWGAVDDIVGPVLFLASSYSDYITGQLLIIDGGASAIIRLTNDEVIR